jgi:hypothetical protein
LNIQALSRSILHGDVKVVGDEQLLAGSVVVARFDRDASTVGRIVSKVDAGNLAGGGVENPDLGGTEVIVE